MPNEKPQWTTPEIEDLGDVASLTLQGAAKTFPTLDGGNNQNNGMTPS